MKTLKRTWKSVAVAVMAVLLMMCAGISAGAESGDNSLYSLGLENGEASPEFYYSTLEYTVTVPAGTEELYLSPVTSDSNANIIDISGTKLNDDGTGTVYITVEAPNGAQVSYTLNVVPDAAAAPTETEPETTAEEAQQAELQRQAESEEALRQQAEAQANKEKVATLTAENNDLNNRINILMKVLYGLVGFAVLLLFLMINQSLRNKDLKDDLKEAKSQADANNEFARKEQNDYYYVPSNNGMRRNMQAQGMPNMQPMADATQSVQAAFGNAPQVLQAQPAPGQVNAPVQQPQEQQPQAQPAETAPQAQAAPVQQQTAPAQSQAAPAQQQTAPAEPVMVQGQSEEPDVSVDMIEL